MCYVDGMPLTERHSCCNIILCVLFITLLHGDL